MMDFRKVNVHLRGKKIECAYCLEEHKGRFWHMKLMKHDGRGMPVCDEHLDEYYEEVLAYQRRLARPTPSDLAEFEKNKDPELARMKMMLKLRLTQKEWLTHDNMVGMELVPEDDNDDK